MSLSTLPARVWLAPMSGVTDAPFRRQAVRFGACAVVSEMVAGETLASGRPDVVRRTLHHGGAGPWIVQLAARRPADMLAGAQLLVQAGVDVIDINMGCPARKVTGGQSGSALMRDLDLATRIIDAAMQGAGSVPVTLKMRLGWDHDSLNAPELAQIAVSRGVRWITVHGRTRCMFYKGEADWRAINDTVACIDVPVIANGDIADIASSRTALRQSGADAVMVGRAAVGQPWLIAQIEAQLAGQSYKMPESDERLDSLRQQIHDSAEIYGERLGVRTVRKHISAAIDALELRMASVEKRALRSRLCQIDGLVDLDTALNDVFSRYTMAEAA